MKYIFSILLILGCAVDPTQVDPGNQYQQEPDNSNVSCVVNNVAWTCNANTWTWTWDNQNRSCSNVGSCKDGNACVLWNGDVGVCQSN